MASDDQIMSHILTKNNLESKKEGKKKTAENCCSISWGCYRGPVGFFRVCHIAVNENSGALLLLLHYYYYYYIILVKHSIVQATVQYSII